MKLVKVLIPFHLSALNKDCVPNDEIEVTDEQLAKIRSININMVEVIGEAKKEAKPKKTTKK